MMTADKAAAIAAAEVGDAGAQRALHDAIAAARAENATWHDVGLVLGISRQAAWERFADAVRS